MCNGLPVCQSPHVKLKSTDWFFFQIRNDFGPMELLRRKSPMPGWVSGWNLVHTLSFQGPMAVRRHFVGSLP